MSKTKSPVNSRKVALKVTAVLLASGKGERAGLRQPKQFAKIYGKEIYRYSLEKFISSTIVTEVILVVPSSYVGKINMSHNKIKVIAGGQRRQDSLLNGLKHLNSDCKVVLVHDCARPFLSEKLIRGTANAANKNGGAIVATAVRDTLKKVSSGFVIKTVDRNNLFRAQTPQAFRTDCLSGFMKLLKGRSIFTDEAAVLEKLKVPVEIVLSDGVNMKITEKEDLKIAGKLLSDGSSVKNRKRSAKVRKS